MMTDTQQMRRTVAQYVEAIASEAKSPQRTRPTWFTVIALAMVVSLLLCLMTAYAAPAVGDVGPLWVVSNAAGLIR